MCRCLIAVGSGASQDLHQKSIWLVRRVHRKSKQKIGTCGPAEISVSTAADQGADGKQPHNNQPHPLQSIGILRKNITKTEENNIGADFLLLRRLVGAAAFCMV